MTASQAASGDVSFRTLSHVELYQGPAESNLGIVYPILGLPALIGTDENLGVRVVLHDVIEGEWAVAISSFGLDLDLQVHDSAYQNGSWILNVSIAGHAPEGLYDLMVSKGSVGDVEKHAVKVGVLPEVLRVVHLTDVHADRFLGSPASEERLLIQQLLDLVNLLGPDLVVFSGDFQGPGTAQPMRLFGEEVLWNLNAPCYLTPGNHEFQEDYETYYRVLSPYPDYSFDFGPVHFVSLTLMWEPDDALKDFIGQELSKDEQNITVLLFHYPSMLPRSFCQSTGPLLALTGHTHNPGVWSVGVQPLRLTTSSAVEGIRMIEFSDDAILSLSYDPSDPRTDMPTSGARVESLSNEGPKVDYQGIKVRNDLAVPLRNCTWTFNLSVPDPGTEALVSGGSLIRSESWNQYRTFLVEFDIPAGSEKYVECLNLPPDTPEARSVLEVGIGDGINDSTVLKSFLAESGSDPDSTLDRITDSLAQASFHLESGDWLRASLEFHRADTVLSYLGGALGDAWNRMREHEEKYLGASIVEGWYLEAALALREGRYRDAWHHLHRITSLEEGNGFWPTTSMKWRQRQRRRELRARMSPSRDIGDRSLRGIRLLAGKR
jgi:hypothetical protein